MSSAEPLGHAELNFPAGIIGLPNLVHFMVRPIDGPLVELMSLEDPDFGFLAISGEIVRPGITELLGLRDLVSDDEEILVVLSIHGEPPVVTANLAGPIVVAADGIARQLVVEDSELPLRATLPRSIG